MPNWEIPFFPFYFFNGTPFPSYGRQPLPYGTSECFLSFFFSEVLGCQTSRSLPTPPTELSESASSVEREGEMGCRKERGISQSYIFSSWLLRWVFLTNLPTLTPLPLCLIIYLILSNYWMRLSKIWIIMQIKEGVLSTEAEGRGG